MACGRGPALSEVSGSCWQIEEGQWMSLVGAGAERYHRREFVFRICDFFTDSSEAIVLRIRG
jgi:hypothetical protein